MGTPFEPRFEAKGQAGSLKAAGRIAARFASWSGRAHPQEGCDIKAFCSERNDFRLEHSPALVLEVQIPGTKGISRWRNAQASKEGIALRITAEGEAERD